MGAVLEKKKKIAKYAAAAIGGLLVVGGAASGISSLFDHFREAAAEQEQREMAQARIKAEKRATIAGLVTADSALLDRRGFTVHRALQQTGSNCAAGGKTTEDGYYGIHTAIAYQATQNGKDGTVCVSHTGRGPLVGTFVAVAPPPPPPPPPPVRPVAPEIEEQKEVLKTLMTNDRNVLGGKGFTLEGPSSNNPKEALGSRCLDDGTTNRTGYNGWQTTISYNVHDSRGRHGQVCVEHNKKTPGAPSRAQFSKSMRPGG